MLQEGATFAGVMDVIAFPVRPKHISYPAIVVNIGVRESPIRAVIQVIPKHNCVEALAEVDAGSAIHISNGCPSAGRRVGEGWLGISEMKSLDDHISGGWIP